jgi:hypothetical protein
LLALAKSFKRNNLEMTKHLILFVTIPENCKFLDGDLKVY